MKLRRRWAALALAAMTTMPALLALLSVPAASAAPREPGARAAFAGGPLAAIQGSGSSWAANAVNEWISNESSSGVQVIFTPSGSATGRQQFSVGAMDFAVSDIPYQGYDPVTGTNDSSKRPYAYLPITAGGTAFPYNLVVGGKRVINLRLSGLTLAKIFTGQITNWDDPAITADNNHRALPSLPITTVVPSEGSGTTAMFTRYLAKMYGSIWGPFNSSNGGNIMTEYWPHHSNLLSQKLQSGSTQIMNYIESPAANGSIGVAEYSYALSAQFPVVNLENTAGYYVLPSMYNDAVALTKAVINMNKSSNLYLTQNLDAVYTNPDPRTYPLSSYSYTVMPISPTDQSMAPQGGAFPSKWQTLADFLSYSICQGQTYIGPIGYSALPVNLVEAGFQQINKIKAAAPKVSLAQQNINNCHNPTFVYGHPSENYLAVHAPMPPQCDKAGQGPCTGTTNGNKNNGGG
ncbi:MAG TPA: substrate-binding domain-containing protein, partial [Streptosporangiaceae bacterium]